MLYRLPVPILSESRIVICMTIVDANRDRENAL